LFEETTIVTSVLGPWGVGRVKRSDRDHYFTLVAEAADEATREGASKVALAQASMATGAKLAKSDPRPLTSPALVFKML
jgi:hypothetical protein